MRQPIEIDIEEEEKYWCCPRCKDSGAWQRREFTDARFPDAFASEPGYARAWRYACLECGGEFFQVKVATVHAAAISRRHEALYLQNSPPESAQHYNVRQYFAPNAVVQFWGMSELHTEAGVVHWHNFPPFFHTVVPRVNRLSSVAQGYIEMNLELIRATWAIDFGAASDRSSLQQPRQVPHQVQPLLLSPAGSWNGSEVPSRLPAPGPARLFENLLRALPAPSSASPGDADELLCAECGVEVRDGQRFCAECGARL
jgi:hypothetical protein